MITATLTRDQVQEYARSWECVFPQEQEIKAFGNQIVLESTETICEHIIKGDKDVTITRKEFKEVWPQLVAQLEYYRNMLSIFATEDSRDSMVNYELMLNTEMLDDSIMMNKNTISRNNLNVALQNTYHRVYSACLLFLSAMRLLYPRFDSARYFADIAALNKDQNDITQ